jgi:hypothetical protein
MVHPLAIAPSEKSILRVYQLLCQIMVVDFCCRRGVIAVNVHLSLQLFY